MNLVIYWFALVPPAGQSINISTSPRWVGTKWCIDIHGPQRINANYFGYLLTNAFFKLVPHIYT